jgi:hypothetical protein
MEAVVRGIVISTLDFYQTVGGQVASQVKHTIPKKCPTPCKNQTKPTQKTTTICVDRLQFVKQKKKKIECNSKKLGCEVGFVKV